MNPSDSILTFSGTPEEMGAQQGAALREAIHFLVEHFLRKSKQIFGVPYDALLAAAAGYEAFIPQEYRLELAALAEAANASYHDLLALNCLPDVDACHMQRAFQCCNVVALTPSGFFAHARNMDFPVPAEVNHRAATVICRKPSSGGVPTLSLAWAGFVGILTGCNASGLSMGEVTAPVLKARPDGMPLAFLMRSVLEQEASLAAGAARIRAAERTHGFNIALASGIEKAALAVECTPRHCATRPMKAGKLVVDNLCLCHRTSCCRLMYHEGVLRHVRAFQLLCSAEDPESINEEFLTRLLQDTLDVSTNEQVKPSHRSCRTICNFMTVQSSIFVHSRQRILYSQQAHPAPMGPYVAANLATLF